MVLFSRPIARNMAGYAQARALYQGVIAHDQMHCPFWILVAMRQRGSVDLRAYFDQQNQLRGISLCLTARGVAFVPLLVACGNEASDARESMRQMLGGLECRYQGLSLVVNSECAIMVSGSVSSACAANAAGKKAGKKGTAPDVSVVPPVEVQSGAGVLAAEGYLGTDLAVRRGDAEFPLVRKGRGLSLADWQQAVRHMPASVMPAGIVSRMDAARRAGAARRIA